MWASALRAVAIGLAVSAPFFIGCSAESDSRPSWGGGTSGTPAYAGPPASAPATGASAQPMLVVVDTDLTMTAQPGEGVGVFTEYATGGHWHVWWTCDTNRTQLGCSFDVNVSIVSGAIANVSGEGLQPGDRLVQSGGGPIDVLTETFAAFEGVTFDTAPGAIITIDAKLNGVDDGRLFFFVQDKLINGDFKGTFTDPLMFEPSSP
jgi:hypothetical protein